MYQKRVGHFKEPTERIITLLLLFLYSECLLVFRPRACFASVPRLETGFLVVIQTMTQVEAHWCINKGALEHHSVSTEFEKKTAVKDMKSYLCNIVTFLHAAFYCWCA